MANKSIDVTALGHSSINYFIEGDDQLLDVISIEKDSTTLINDSKAQNMLNSLPIVNEEIGGNVMNAIINLEHLGGVPTFISRVADDKTGERIVHELNSININNQISALKGITAKYFHIVTPDKINTTAKYLGTAGAVSTAEIDEETIKKSKVLLIEGSLWESEDARDAIMMAIDIASKNNTVVALSLDDDQLISRFHSDFTMLIENHIDIIFSSTGELRALYETADEDESIARAEKHCALKHSIVVINCDVNNLYVINQEGKLRLDLKKWDFESTTGLGSALIGGFLYSYTHKFNLARSLLLAQICIEKILYSNGSHFIYNSRELVQEMQTRSTSDLEEYAAKVVNDAGEGW